MKTMLIGYGNVGKALHGLLKEQGTAVDMIVRSTGIYAPDGQKLDTIDNFDTYVDRHTLAYISIPSERDATRHLAYYLTILERWGYVVTCEKSVLAHYWHILKPYMSRLWYSATVGGNSGILPELHRYAGAIHTIKAVINGTLNIVSEESARGMPETAIYDFVTSQGYAEPGSRDFQEMIDAEMQDVLYKSVILANHSGMYHGVVRLPDITLDPYREGGRCMFLADKHHIRAGFIHDEDTSWFPTGVDNVLVIDGHKVAEWPGAGPIATAQRMYLDGLNAL